MNIWKRGILAVTLLLGASSVGGRVSGAQADTRAIEAAVLAVHAEMTRAGEAVDADRLFSYMLETDKGSVIQNGEMFATRQQALERVKGNLRNLSRVQYRWTRELVSVLSRDVAVLSAEGESTVTTAAGDTFTAPFAQSVVFVLRGGAWKAIHAHQSSPQR